MLQQTFREKGIGYPFGMQLCGKTLGIVGMGAIGEPHVSIQQQSKSFRLMQSGVYVLAAKYGFTTAGYHSLVVLDIVMSACKVTC